MFQSKVDSGKMDMKPLSALPLIVLLCAASGAGAQTLYKSTMPDGKVIYGEKPAPGAKRVDTLASPPAQTGTTIVTPAEKSAASQRVDKRAAGEAAAQRELDTARQQLQQAEAERNAGKEPLPGERIGTASGASRLTDDYWARQKRLDQAVESARQRVEQAQQAAR
jgi:hypothetical protein